MSCCLQKISVEQGQEEFWGGHGNFFKIDDGGNSQSMQLLAFIEFCTLNIYK